MILTVTIPLICSFKIISQEFSHNTIYLLLSAPLSGSRVLGAKLAAILSQFLLGMGIGLVSALLVLWPDLLNSGLTLPDGWATIILAFVLLGFAFVLFLFCSSFFGQMIARLFRRFHSVVSLIVFVLVIRLASKLAVPGNELIMMNIHSGAWNLDSSALITLYTPSLVFILAAIILFILSVLIYDNKIEL